MGVLCAVLGGNDGTGRSAATRIIPRIHDELARPCRVENGSLVIGVCVVGTYKKINKYITPALRSLSQKNNPAPSSPLPLLVRIINTLILQFPIAAPFLPCYNRGAERNMINVLLV